LLVEAAPEKVEAAVNEEAERQLKVLLSDLPLKQAVKLAVEITGAKKNDLYELALQLKETN
jgi:16S rRNA (cytidine1402-2'-O)-methyltransferase